ncbi:MAG: hypothetical protein FJ109_02220 [Deltaproteobacteria bacterium]|nr:hypothetical protein [Deltaproteobacteria bacterium]
MHALQPKTQPPVSPGVDYVIFSDLHLGEGFNPEVCRYYPLEDFFHDRAFAGLMGQLRERYAADPSRLVIVLNGDVFDFLTVTGLPSEPSQAELGIFPSPTEKRLGLDPTPTRSLFKLDLIVAGHPEFFAALGRMVASGFRVEILRGNHDMELYFDVVQQRILESLCRLAPELTPEKARRLVAFHQWFFLEPDRVYIEHGNQYEASNSIRYTLRPVLPEKRPKEGLLNLPLLRAKTVVREDQPVLDYPLGSLFIRYFYNRVHRMNPYAPRVASLEQYLDFILHYNLSDIVRVLRDHWSHFIAALRPGATAGTSRSTAAADAVQEEQFDQIEESQEVSDLCSRLNALKVHPKAASKLAFVKEMFRPIVRRVLFAGGAAVAALYVWLLVFNIIQAPLLVENVFAKATLLFLFSLLSAGVLVWLGAQARRFLGSREDVTVDNCVQAAEQIARITGVRFVVMGHTHVVDIRPVAGGQAVYANSGTWIAVHNPWQQLDPDARRKSFVWIRGGEVQLCRWNDDAQRVDLVPMFDRREDTVRTPRRIKPM